MSIKKNNLVTFHPPYPKAPTVARRDVIRTARVVDTNEKPAAVKVGPFAKTKKNGDVTLHGPRRRRWIPVAFVEDVVAETVEGTVLNP